MTIPRSADLASDVLTHTYDDMFNPPGLTNFLGAARIAALRADALLEGKIGQRHGWKRLRGQKFRQNGERGFSLGCLPKASKGDVWVPLGACVLYSKHSDSPDDTIR